ncbi:MAG: sigma-54 dependent transcriptional regulator [Gemmatimonadaceae bacterium]
MAKILIVDDDKAFRLSTAALLRADGYDVDCVADGAAAAESLRAARHDLVVLDLRMPGVDGLGVVEALRLWGERVPILMLSGYGTVDAAVRALHLGADDFLTKPVEPEILSSRIADLLARRPLPESAPANPAGMVGRSPAMRETIASLRRVAAGYTTVLITGETGTGKELAARAVHDLSPRSAAPFIAVNCAALAEGVLESELFGHVRGAFTGAAKDRVGVFEAAIGGTIFLDEIGEMSGALQLRLLRVLQEREVTRVGSSRAVKVDVRVVAATNRDLGELVAQGRFREDLYYRLAVFPVALAPLRERRADIPLLVEHALSVLRSRRDGADRLACSPLAMRLLRNYDWPGNVRQLFGVVERAAVEAEYERIEGQHLPTALRPVSSGGLEMREQRYRGTGGGEDERAAIVSALEATGGALAQSAEILGMGRTTLWRKLKQLGLTATGSDEADPAR